MLIFVGQLMYCEVSSSTEYLGIALSVAEVNHITWSVDFRNTINPELVEKRRYAKSWCCPLPERWRNMMLLSVYSGDIALCTSVI